MSKITRQDSDGVKPLLSTGELGYDNYPAGGDVGRVYVGTGSANIAQAKKSEVDSAVSTTNAHIGNVNNPHAVTKAQVGLSNADNTSDNVKNVLSATKWTAARTITLAGDLTGSVSIDGSANVILSAAVAANSITLGTDTTGNYVAGNTAGTGISITGTAGEGWSPTIALTNVGAAGTYRSVTTDVQGRVTAGTNPTTVSGYGLTDVYTKTENNTSLALKVNNSEKGVANGIATLDTNGKVVLTQIPDSVLGQLEYIGIWNFATLPTATEKGQYWIASVAGNGYEVGDWAVWNGSAFDKVDNTDAVATVAGRTGNVVLTKSDVGLGLVDNTADASKNVLSATKWAASRTITLSGDVAGSASIDGSANVTITSTVQPNSVTLGTDTTGNYVAGVTAGTGISISGTAGEGWSPTITNTAPNVTTNITTAHNATNVVVNSSDGTNGTINGATPTLAGVMTATDKSKLDGITTGATANVGTVTSIATSGAITGGTITSTGTISHSTADGYLHVPATGTTNNGKVLTAGATAGSLSWTAIPSAPVASVAGKTGAVTLVKGDVGLGSVDNTADSDKNVLSATKLTTARTIGGVSFDGTSNINLPGVNAAGNQSTTGNSATATVLQTARTIGMSGVAATATSFNGSANIIIPVTSVPTSLLTGVIADANISGSYTGMVNLTGSGIVDFSRFLGNTSDTVAAPSFSWTGDLDTGIYQPAANQLAITTGGVQSALFSSSGITGTLVGNAATATKLQTPRTITLSGDVSGSTSFDGSGNVSITTTVADDSHNHTFANLTSTPATATRWPTWSEVSSKPTTFAPSPHTHTVSQVTDLGTAATRNVGTGNGNVMDSQDVRIFGGANSGISNPDSITSNTITYSTGTTATGLFQDGAIYAQYYAVGSYGHQIFGDYRSGGLAVRGLNNGVWTPWRQVYHSGNLPATPPTNLGITAGKTAGPIVTSSTGTNATLPTASATASGVLTTGAQTIAGVKTFVSSPIVPVPIANTQAVNKEYVDSTIIDQIGLIDYGYVAKSYHIVAFGGEFNRADYPKLWAYLQANPTLVKTQAQWTTESTANGGICGFYSSGNGTTTFRVPNLDKAFLRPDNRAIASYQADEFKAHSHNWGNNTLSIYAAGAGAPGFGNSINAINSTSLTGGVETRPKNIAVLPLIVAK